MRCEQDAGWDYLFGGHEQPHLHGEYMLLPGGRVRSTEHGWQAEGSEGEHQWHSGYRTRCRNMVGDDRYASPARDYECMNVAQGLLAHTASLHKHNLLQLRDLAALP